MLVGLVLVIFLLAFTADRVDKIFALLDAREKADRSKENPR